MDIEDEIEEYNQRVYGGSMSIHNKNTLRSMIEEENKFWERNQAFEERGHSNSVVMP